jgi:hypothetical protein
MSTDAHSLMIGELMNLCSRGTGVLARTTYLVTEASLLSISLNSHLLKFYMLVSNF